MTITEMCVHMDCSGCESRIRKALEKLEGVDNVEIDMARQKVTVSGYIEQKKVLKAVRKTGRRAVLWPYPYNPESNTQQYYYHQNRPTQPVADQYYPSAFAANPFAYSTASTSSYNYRKHGYDESVMHGNYHVAASSTIVGDGVGSMFSDDNPNACSVM